VLVDPSRERFERVSMTNAGSTTVSVTLEAVGPHGLRIGRTVTVAPHEMTVVSGRRLGRLVGGVLLLAASGPITATGEVRDALLGSDLLAAVPVG
jgi:hypothetical protein